MALKKGEKEQSFRFERLTEFGSNSKPIEASSRTEDDRLSSTQENRETLPFGWSVKTADERQVAVGKLVHQIIHLHSQCRRALSRAKNGQLASIENLEIAERGRGIRRIAGQVARQSSGILWIAFAKQLDLRLHLAREPRPAE